MDLDSGRVHEESPRSKPSAINRRVLRPPDLGGCCGRRGPDAKGQGTVRSREIGMLYKMPCTLYANIVTAHPPNAPRRRLGVSKDRRAAR